MESSTKKLGMLYWKNSAGQIESIGPGDAPLMCRSNSSYNYSVSLGYDKYVRVLEMPGLEVETFIYQPFLFLGWWSFLLPSARAPTPLGLTACLDALLFS